MPLPVPIPPSPEASEALLVAFAERGINWRPRHAGQSALDPTRHVAVTTQGDEIPFDLFLGVPVHVAPDVVLESGMCVDGWIPVDPRTLETRFAGVYAVGDVTSVGTPKAGVFAEGQAKVVAAALIADAASQIVTDRVRRPRPVLLGVRSRPGGEGRRDVLTGRCTVWLLRSAFGRAGRAKVRLRLVESPALVRPRMVDVLSHPTVPGSLLRTSWR